MEGIHIRDSEDIRGSDLQMIFLGRWDSPKGFENGMDSYRRFADDIPGRKGFAEGIRKRKGFAERILR